MDVFFSIIIFVLLLAFTYVLFNYKLMKTIDVKFKEVYKNKIYSDMQEFYREMESYSALLENRIGRFKKLVERQDENLVKWQEVLDQVKRSRKGKQISEFIEKSLAKEQQLIEAIGALQMNSADLLQNIESSHSEQKKKLRDAMAQPNSQKFKPAPMPATGPAIEKPVQAAAMSPPKANSPGGPLPSPAKAEDPGHNTLSAAEELVMAMPDQREPAQAATAAPAPVVGQQATAPPSWAKILSRLGKTFAPFLFGKKDSATPAMTREPATQQNPRPVIEKPATDFGQMLEQKKPPAPTKGISLQPAVGNNSLISKEMSAKKSQITTLSKEELIQILDDLHDAKKRPKALKMLLMQGFKLEKIADLAEIPYSDLEATRSIYGL